LKADPGLRQRRPTSVVSPHSADARVALTPIEARAPLPTVVIADRIWTEQVGFVGPNNESSLGMLSSFASGVLYAIIAIGRR
jgi:hypothetical protein